jgi:hypothetical protein
MASALGLCDKSRWVNLFREESSRRKPIDVFIAFIFTGREFKWY